MSKPAFDPGFTEQYRGNLSRIINPDGRFNVRRRGTNWRDVHPYLFMLNVSWSVFSALILAGYLGANLVFALVYYYGVGMAHLHGRKPPASSGSFSMRFSSAPTR